MATPGSHNGTAHWHADTRWFHLLRALVSSGDLARLSGAALKVYIAIKAASDLFSGESSVQHPQLMQQTGLSLSHLKRAIVELIQAGYLTRERRGRLPVYHITEKIAIAGHDGTPAGHARWDYMPGTMHHAMREVKEVVTREILGDVPVVYITLQVNIAQDQAHVINMQESLEKITDPDLREAIIQAFSHRPDARLP